MAHYNWIAIVLLCSFGPTWAANQELGTRVLVQPDGTRFSVREYVDEFGHYLWADAGYVIQDAITGYYYYARYDNTGNATPSTLQVGLDDASSEVAQLARDNDKALMEMAGVSHGVESLADAAGKASAITFPEELLVLLVEFSDVKHQNPIDWPITDKSLLVSSDCIFTEAGCVGKEYSEYTVANFEDMLFGDYSGEARSPDNEDTYGSMRQYYEDMSRGDYTIKGRVVNQVRADDSDIPIWVTLGKEKSDYHRPDGKTTPEALRKAKKSFRNAVLAAAASKGISATPSATRPFCIIYAGNGYYKGGLNPHYAPDENIYIMSERTGSSFGVEFNDANFAHIGTHCHEFGHVLKMSDKYGGDNAYGQWGLMASGGHKGGRAHPSPLSPHHRAELGWLKPTEVEVTGFMKGEELSYSSNQDDVYRIRSFSDRDPFSLIGFLINWDDFFLIENRQPDERWNKGLPGGLLIWHIKDKTGVYYDEIDLVEADNSNASNASNRAGDPFPGSTGNTNLTDFTSPSSRQFPLDDKEPSLRDHSNVLVTNISTSGLEMTANLSPFWVGTITESTTWSGTVRVGGDITVPTDVTLEIAANTVIQFIADTDDTDAVAGEMDTDRSELIVQGTLRASAGGITFRSTHDDPDDADWYGIRVLPGGYVDLSNASLYDGVLCVSNEGGSLTLNDNTTFDNCGTLLWISGNPTPTFPENRETQEVVATYTAQDAGGNAVAVAWSLAVNPSETFTINNEGQLLFQNSPDFEDLNGEPTYHITIQAEDSQSAAVAELKVTVTVENENEEGMVTVMPTTPRVDEELKATLKDLDGVVSETTGWIWSAKSADEITTFVHLQFSGETSHYTPEWSDVGQVLQVQVSYTDGHGADKMEISAPTAAVVGPELVGRESLTFVEHGTFVEDGEEVVPTYTVSGVDGTATWSLDGTDAGAFDLAAAASGGVSLSFSSPPNFEKPTDTDKGGPNTYHVTIVATLTAAAETAEEPLADLFAAFQNLSDDTESAQASSAALTQAVVVTVENGDDPGVVELLPAGPPRVGHSLTARLVDEDEDLTDMVWTWLADGDVVRPASPSGETTDGYEPQPEDEGRALQTQVRYKDPFGAKTVVSAPTAAVLPAGVVSLSPNPPRLCQPVTAELSGPEEVTGETWTWERQRQGSDKWDLLWSSSSPDKTASDSDLAYLFSAYNRGSGKVSRYQPTEEDLDRVLRATVSWDGHEASDRAPVGASAPGLPRHLEGEGRAAKVVLSWRTPNNCGSAITGYEYQYRLAEETHYYHDDDRPWGEVGQGANRRLTAASYRRRDFLRMLAGGYDVGGHPEPFVTPEHGPNITVANNHQLPAVFGSVRAYFEAVSDGAFHLIAQTQTL